LSARRRKQPVELDVIDRFRPRTDRDLVRRVVEAVLDHEDRRDLSVSLLLTGDDEIAELHGRFLGDPTETDVMSFETDGTADVVVNVARARREAKARGTTIRAEVALYVAHGLLHVCGHDDHDAEDRAAMRAAETAVLAQLGLRHAQVDAPR
jgi:probable rRNA maturation factor